MQCISDYLEDGFKDRLLAASEFSLMTDETTDISDRAELSIFVRYVDSDTHKISEEFLGCLLYTSPSPRDLSTSRMPSSA